MKKKKIPLRKCIGCCQNKKKQDLIRVVRDKDKNVIIDVLGKANGRGAYICKNIECFEEIEKEKKLSRVLRVNVPVQIYKDLKNVVKLESNNR